MKKIYTIFVCICLLAGFVACEKDKDFVLTKLMVQNETITPYYGSATIDCSFKADATISEAFVQYSLSSSFAKYDVAKMTEEKGKYVAQLTDLQDNTTYYIRYAVSNKYSSVVSEEVIEFQTLQCTVPTVVLDSIVDVWDNRAKAYLHLAFDGGASVTGMGICWSKQANPTIEDIHKSTKDTVAVLDMTDLQPSTTYYVRAYATNEKGTAYGEQVSFTTKEQSSTPNNGTENGYAYVDLGLSVKWATMNVGASKAEDYGDYFAWGETTTKTTYNWSTYKYCNGSYSTFTKYNTSSSYGTVDNKTQLELTDDAARVNWGGSWRMPTDAELTELLTECTWTWTTQTGVYGYKVTSKKNGTSIFLPAAGFRDESSLHDAGSGGFCWSSSLDTDNPYYAWRVYFYSSYVYRLYFNRCCGLSVRPVLGNPVEQETTTPTVTTTKPSSITQTTAVAGGNVIADGNASVTERGVCIATESNPTTSNTKVTAGSGTGSFTCNLTDLQPNTTYYVRAYATNEVGTAYGEEVSFTTKEQSSTEPVVTETITVNGVSFKMVAVEGGTFTMGATSEQGTSDPYDDEYPTHSVTLSNFSIGETEVTQELWKAVMGSNPSYFSGTNLPVEDVSWNDCQTFISKLNNLTGKNFRLPTEAEWEYAARGGNKSKGYKYAGSNTLGDVAWYDANSSSMTHPVKQKQANELGLYDMSGNVWEWCQDWKGSYSSSAQTNPTGPTSGSDRVDRGGSYNGIAMHCRVSLRDGYAQGDDNCDLGLRLALGAAVELEVALPTLTTSAVTQITETTAVAGGNVTADGNASVTERGVVYGKSPNPTISNLNNTIRPCGSGMGEFTYNMTDLQPSTTYYVRAYAINSKGTAYGEEVSFTTNEEMVDNPPSNMVAKPFSVSAGKQVTFSQGNLQYTQSTNTWSFAKNQWDMIGTDNVIGGSVTSDPTYGYDKKYGTALADKVDLFGWSTSATNFGVSTSMDENDYSGSFVDWGANTIGDDAPNTWRTLSYDEWYYLRHVRTNANDLVGVAQVNGVNGLILLPDNWTCPTGITFKSGFHTSDGVDYYAAYQTFTAEQWSKLESAGAVFLPAAGNRYGSDVGGVQNEGYYWSATESTSDFAYYLNFSSDGARMHGITRNYGLSVRLVKDL